MNRPIGVERAGSDEQAQTESSRTEMRDFVIGRARQVRASIPGMNTLYHTIAELADENDKLRHERATAIEYRDKMRDERDTVQATDLLRKRENTELRESIGALAAKLGQAETMNAMARNRLSVLEAKNKELEASIDGFLATPATPAVWVEVESEVRRARAKYPQWPNNIVHAAAIASEEMGEVVKDCNTYQWRQGNATLEDIHNESIQAMAMLYRFLTETPFLNKRIGE